MKKIYWVFPGVMFLVSLIAVMILNARDINPTEMVFSTKAADVVTISEAQAVTILENNLDSFNARANDDTAAVPSGVKSVTREGNTVKFVVDSKFGGFEQYFTYGTAGEPYDSGAEEGYNLAAYRRELFDGWTYCVDHIKEITFTKQYTEEISYRLNKMGYASGSFETELVLMSKSLCPSPAEKSKSAYVVRARILLPDGELLTGYLDPKAKAMIGFEEIK